MSDDSVTFTIDTQVAGVSSIDAAATSTEKLEGSGISASKAMVATSDAIKAGEASYRKAEQAADGAAKALERIGVAAAAQRGKLQLAMESGDDKGAEKAAARLRVLTTQQGDAKTKAEAAAKAMKDEAVALDKLKGSADKTETSVEKGEIRFGTIGRALNKLGGPLAEAGAKGAELGHAFEGLSKSFGSGGAAAIVGSVAIVALAASVLALTAAVISGLAHITAWAVGLADANRSASLLAQGIARSVSGGAQLDDKITDLTKVLPLTREELSSTAQELANAGLRGDALTNALQRSAVAAAKLKFGPDFEEQMLSLDEQSKVFHADLADTFGSLKVEGLLGGLQKLVSLFDSSTESGHALKVLFESIFQPIVDGLTGAVPKVERFFLQLELLTLKAMISIKPYGSTILKIAEAFAIGAAVIVGVFVVALGLVVAGAALTVAALGGIVAGIVWVNNKIADLTTSIVGFFKGLDLVAVGKAMIDGLVNGIAGGATAVLNAMKGVVDGAINGAKKLLGIASPSKVFAEIGMQTGAGMEQGVSGSAGGVRDSLESMVSPPSAGGSGAAPAASAASSSRSGATITIILNGVQGATEAIDMIREEVTRMFEGDAAQLGAT